MKIIYLLLCLAILGTGISHAQPSHNTNCMRCKYSKDYIGNRKPGDAVKGRALNECACAACGEQAQKEKAARQAEQIRRDEAVAKQQKAEQEAKKRAFEAAQLKKQEEAKAAQRGEVVINDQGPAKAVPQPQKKTASSSSGFMRGGGGSPHFYSEDGEIVRPERAGQRPIYRAFGTSRIAGTATAGYLHPAETGVVEYVNNPPKYCNEYGLEMWDIVDYDWQPLFNDESVHYIEHFFGDWFFIGYLPCDDYEHQGNYNIYFQSVKLYNVSTKQFHNIEIEGPVAKLGVKRDETHGSYHRGVGAVVFHNPYYFTGQFEKKEGIKHGAFELLFDEATSGVDGWKAAVGFDIYTGGKAAQRMVYLMDKDGNFKSFIYDSRYYWGYSSKDAQ